MSDLVPPQSHRRDLRLFHPEIEARIESWLEARDHSWQQLESGALRLPKPPGFRHATPLESLQLALILGDPVLFAETQYLERADNGGGPWRLFDYQKPSLRYPGSVVNASAAGVGKTRELEILIGYGLVARPGSILVVGNQEGTVDTILRDFRWQLEQNPWLASQVPPDKIKLRPRRILESVHGNVCLMIPTGSDGEPLRGQHITGYLLGDEADKWDEPEIWNELWRAVEPGCVVRLYSVLTGHTNTEFYRLRQRATPINRADAARFAARHAGRPHELPDFALVHWRKRDMPSPFWTPKRKRELVERYGGEDTSGYRRNVEGELGDPVELAFRREHIAAAVRPILDYRRLVVRHDPGRGVVETSITRTDPTWTSGPDGLLTPVEHRHVAADFDLCQWVVGHLDDLDVGGFYVVGVDYGRGPDPTEILIFHALGDRVRFRLVRRIQLRKIDYPAQGQLHAEIHRVLMPLWGWGADANGAGAVVVEHARVDMPPESITPWLWTKTVPVIAPDGTPRTDGNGHPLVVDTKTRATELIEDDLSRGEFHLPPDPEVIREFENHTETARPDGRRKFATQHDHTIEATRAARLRYHQVTAKTSGLPSLDQVRTLARPPRVGTLHGLGSGALRAGLALGGRR